MANDILTYLDMCQREGVSLQRGMNFRLGATYSVVLMSVRPNAPYGDELSEDGTVIVYEGHDEPRRPGGPDPKQVDQPAHTRSGRPTQNGLFHQAAQQATRGDRPPERVRVYEKIRQGIWAYNGVFHLVDSWQEQTGGRRVFRFRLVAVEGEDDMEAPVRADAERRRIIPTAVKVEVWQRDGGKCVICGATDELHFDHIVPFSKGGSSIVAENVQLLCARHNIQKGARIE